MADACKMFVERENEALQTIAAFKRTFSDPETGFSGLRVEPRESPKKRRPGFNLDKLAVGPTIYPLSAQEAATWMQTAIIAVGDRKEPARCEAALRYLDMAVLNLPKKK